jgi:hypothetical protein
MRAFRVAVPLDAKVKICVWITSAMVKGFPPEPRGNHSSATPIQIHSKKPHRHPTVDGPPSEICPTQQTHVDITDWYRRLKKKNLPTPSILSCSTHHDRTVLIPRMLRLAAMNKMSISHLTTRHTLSLILHTPRHIPIPIPLPLLS